ncbi:MAG: AlwI family type II restriction endonuclease [Bacteroidota bacterium]
MASIDKSKTLFAFTSPRTLEKVIPEIELLGSKLSGQSWEEKTQIEFFKLLAVSDFYHGTKTPKDIPFAARDRITRAPKALGFVDLKPKIKITPAGRELLKTNRIADVFTRQLIKFQLPSPYHTQKKSRFFIKPYLELLHLLKAVDSLSKTEIALFFLQYTHIENFDTIVKKVLDYREHVKRFKGSRRTYAYQQFEQEVKKVYQEEIEAKQLKTRESSDLTLQKFIKTKRSNWIDYADAFIRYLRATELISFQKNTLRVIISPSKFQEVDHILRTIDRNPTKFESKEDFKKYLFSAENIILFYDIRANLVRALEKLSFNFDSSLNINKLKELLKNKIEDTKTEKIVAVEKSLKDFRAYDDILSIFERLEKREVPDPPLYMEWNVWRAMVMLNYAISVKGNFKIDLDGVPLSFASGNMPDIEIEYDDFVLIVEVTMSRGNKQFEMEGESVARHFGKKRRATNKDVYCLFIAPKVSEATLAHFFNLNRFTTRYYGGKTQIVPMNLKQFLAFIQIAKEHKLSSSMPIKNYFENAIRLNSSATPLKIK